MLKEDAGRFGGKLSEVEGDSERAEAQRDRGEGWSELADSIDGAVEQFEDALETVESLLA